MTHKRGVTDRQQDTLGQSGNSILLCFDADGCAAVSHLAALETHKDVIYTNCAQNRTCFTYNCSEGLWECTAVRNRRPKQQTETSQLK